MCKTEYKIIDSIGYKTVKQDNKSKRLKFWKLKCKNCNNISITHHETYIFNKCLYCKNDIKIGRILDNGTEIIELIKINNTDNYNNKVYKIKCSCGNFDLASRMQLHKNLKAGKIIICKKCQGLVKSKNLSKYDYGSFILKVKILTYLVQMLEI